MCRRCLSFGSFWELPVSVCLPPCLSDCLSDCLPARLSFACLSAFLSVCPFTCAASNREVVNVQAETAGVVWCMERSTFRSIIVVSSMQKRQRYEECLASMPLFASLTLDQRAAIADCLSLETFQVCPPPVSPAGCGAMLVGRSVPLHACQCIDGSRAVCNASSAHGDKWQAIAVAQGVAGKTTRGHRYSLFLCGTDAVLHRASCAFMALCSGQHKSVLTCIPIPIVVGQVANCLAFECSLQVPLPAIAVGLNVWPSGMAL